MIYLLIVIVDISSVIHRHPSFQTVQSTIYFNYVSFVIHILRVLVLVLVLLVLLPLLLLTKKI